MSLSEIFAANPKLAVELVLALRGTRAIQAFPYAFGMPPRLKLIDLGLLNSHGWPSGRGYIAEDLAVPVADEWARGHGADTFDAYLEKLYRGEKP